MIKFLKKFANQIRQNEAQLNNLDSKKQQLFLDKIDTPIDDIECSFYQFKSQMYLLGKMYSAIYNIVSLPLYFYYKKKLIKKNNVEKEEQENILFLFSGSMNIVPNSLKNGNRIKQIKDFQSYMILQKEDLVCLEEIGKRCPSAWHFRLKVLLKIGIYRYWINKYDPQTIIVSSEYSFTSSVLTWYCEQLGIEHVNVMHGEKLFDVTDSFFHFHRCYIWDEYYKALFIDLRAEPTQFIVEKPKAVLPWEIEIPPKKIDFTYYLGGETNERLERIKMNMVKLTQKGKSVAIRPHPRYGDFEKTKSIFSEFLVEDNNEISIQESILRTKNVISLYSTVITQAEANGVDVVIDDLSNREDYQRIFELRYYYVRKAHKKLSGILENGDNG